MARATGSTTGQQGDVLLILLCGDKSSQDKDIKQAHEIAKEWEHRGN